MEFIFNNPLAWSHNNNKSTNGIYISLEDTNAVIFKHNNFQAEWLVPKNYFYFGKLKWHALDYIAILEYTNDPFYMSRPHYSFNAKFTSLTNQNIYEYKISDSISENTQRYYKLNCKLFK